MILNSKKLTKRLWAEAVNTICCNINRVYFRPGTSKTPYEIWRGKKPNLGYFHIFGSTCYILNDREQLGKFDAKSDVGVFLGYSNNSRAYRVYNMRTQTTMESANVVVDDFSDFVEYSKEDEIQNLMEDTDSDKNVTTQPEVATQSEGTIGSDNHVSTSKSNVTISSEQTSDELIVDIRDPSQKVPSSRVKKNHPTDLIIGDLEDGKVTRRRNINLVQFL